MVDYRLNICFIGFIGFNGFNGFIVVDCLGQKEELQRAIPQSARFCEYAPEELDGFSKYMMPIKWFIDYKTQ